MVVKCIAYPRNKMNAKGFEKTFSANVKDEAGADLFFRHVREMGYWVSVSVKT